MGYFKDWYVEVNIVGVRSRFLGVCPADALAYHGDERSLDRYVGDTDDIYRTRLVDAWQLWTFAGTAYGIIKQLNSAGFNHIYIEEGATFGPDHSQWWKFWVIIDDTFDHVFGSVAWFMGDGYLMGGGKNLGFTNNPPNESSIRPIINKWKPATTILAQVIVILDGWVMGDPLVLMGDGHLLGGTAVNI
jgi:hypothetical protein